MHASTKRLLACLLGLVPLASAGRTETLPPEPDRRATTPQQETAHPVDSYLVRPDGIEVFVLTRDIRATDGLASLLGASFDESRLAGTIGTLDGPPETLIGELAGVLIDDEDRVYLLDEAYKELRVFAHDGRFLASAGGSGEGPGEFRDPRALGFAPGREDVLAGDLGRQFERFRFEEGELRHIETKRVEEFTPTAMCPLGDLLLLHGPVYQGDSAFHFLSAEGTIERSFGAIYRAPTAIINFVVSEGRVVCSPAGDRFAFAPNSVLGEARGYDAEGTLRWITKIEPFRSVGLVESGGGYRVTLLPEGFHRIESLTLLPPDRVLLQVGLAVPAPEEAGANARPEVEELHSYLLDMDTGAGVYVGDQVPKIVGVNERYVVTSRLVGEDEPYRELRVYRRD